MYNYILYMYGTVLQDYNDFGILDVKVYKIDDEKV